MFGLTTTRRLRREALILHGDIVRIRAERDTAREERDAFKEAARTAARQFTESDDAHQTTARQASQATAALAAVTRRLQDLRDKHRPIDGGSPKPLTPSVELLRARAQIHALEERLAELTAANHQCTCQSEGES